jgi:MFS family permease
MAEKHDPYAAFRISDYRIYVIGWLVALMGTRIQTVAISWEMYQRTGQALSLGLVGLTLAVPTMLFALPAGYLADRFERRKLVMLSLAGMALTSLGLGYLSYVQGSTTLMYMMLFLDATAIVLGRPARTAMLPQIVPREVFPNAVTWNTTLMQLASVVGPGLGGFVLVYDISAAYVISALGSLFFIVILTRLNYRPGPRPSQPRNLDTLFQGVKFVWDERILFTLMSLDLFAVLLGGAVYLLPIFAEDILKVGATGYGWLQAAPAAGSGLMALSLVYLPPMRRAGRILLAAIAGFGLATIVFGLSTSFALSWAMLFMTGALDNISMVVRQTLTQLLTPDEMRGRVSAVSSIFIGASNELGGLESGVVAQYFGPVFSVVSGGIGTLIVVATTALLSPRLLAIDKLHETKPERVR